jgi:hypothetical protein
MHRRAFFFTIAVGIPVYPPKNQRGRPLNAQRGRMESIFSLYFTPDS